ncbi:ornithine carbamoyltransferase [Oceanospirillum multiglobuliferum]|uniref:Ornithine carbamoyltransferase n=1 Tax=Oceanospirillum multiglobuliferum TaxID=64969 RepID=A0A1T4MNP6_9GAMM|nr:ornithine carbamoyltransferase [Oceanospirillum multiglobuliferum]OPX56944.1 ornithine carbamoyltransferase [Oceanospirillum multiglobuliferum]SJZ68730.1 ornithine carbamoyltransferase [Oceanospirillum multiglobuliferum]
MARHFLTLLDFTPDELHYVIERAITIKKEHKAGKIYEPLKNKVLGMIFEKASTRTRVSFEAGIAQLGGSAIFLSPRDTQLGRGEPVEDSARVLSEMVDIVMIRTFEHALVERFAEYSSIPVINALTDDYHPCQLIADIQTFIELRGSIQGKTVAWVGDGNNMCNSYINAAQQFDFHLNIACPEGYEPMASLMEEAKDRISLYRTPEEAIKGAHLVSTDVWASMGMEEEQQARFKAFKGYQVSPALMDTASEDALFMHCLPAHRGEEISEDMLDDPRAVAWQEAGNRLHVQKALMEFLLLGKVDS